MKPERWQQVDQLFQAALDREPAERAAFISEACGGDDSLRRHVEELLAADGKARSLIEAPAYAIGAPLIAGDAAQSLVGKSIGHFQIISLLGKGGMGEVYRARDTKLDRAVALKILPAEMSADRERMRRFVREAKAASALNHPNLAHIYEIGGADGVSFIAMEYVEGQTLAAKINGHPLETSETVEIGSQIADALDAAQGKGITHRDIKPANVMITPRGQVKVLDFGLAKIGRPESVDSKVSTLVPTTPGVVLGTVPYMSPEQALGREVDHRSDLFSLGVVLYEMATGRLPFLGANTGETLDRILHAEPEGMARFNYDLPPDLERIVRKCLEKDRERRYQSARELLVDLKNLKRESASNAPPMMMAEGLTSKVALHRRGPLIALAVLALSATAIIYLLARAPVPPKVTSSHQITTDGRLDPTRLTFYSAAPIVSDGSRLYFSKVMGGQRILAQVSSTGGDTIELPMPFADSRVMDLSLSRSEMLVMESKDGSVEKPLWVVPVLGGSPRRLGDILAHAAAWSPDGGQIVYAHVNDLYLVSNDGAERRKLLTLAGRPQWPRWSPDGSRLRFSVYDLVNRSSSLWEVASDGSNLHRLLPDWNRPEAEECCGNWTADGRHFVFQVKRDRTTQIWAMREKASIFQRASLEPVQLTFGPLNFYAPLPSMDGRRIFVVGEQRRGELIRYDSKRQQFVRYLEGLSAEAVAFSRDGQWVAYVSYPEGSLWRSKADGSKPLRLNLPPMLTHMPRWSPDGTKIVFMGTRPGRPMKIYQVAAETGGNPEQLMPEDRYESDPNWSPDGKTLVFTVGTRASGNHAIYLLDINSRQVSALPGAEKLSSPRWSPDGRYILALQSDFRNLMIYDFTTRQWEELVTMRAGGYPSWSRDSKYVYFSDESAIFRVGVLNRRVEPWVSLKDLRLASGMSGIWMGLTPDDSPMVLRDIGIQDIYALEWQTP